MEEREPTPTPTPHPSFPDPHGLCLPSHHASRLDGLLLDLVGTPPPHTSCQGALCRVTSAHVTSLPKLP